MREFVCLLMRLEVLIFVICRMAWKKCLLIFYLLLKVIHLDALRMNSFLVISF